MASLSCESGGRKTIQFVGPDRKRRSIRLGKISKSKALMIKTRVEELISSNISGLPISAETSKWIADLDAKLSDRLARDFDALTSLALTTVPHDLSV